MFTSPHPMRNDKSCRAFFFSRAATQKYLVAFFRLPQVVDAHSFFEWLARNGIHTVKYCVRSLCYVNWMRE